MSEAQENNMSRRVEERTSDLTGNDLYAAFGRSEHYAGFKVGCPRRCQVIAQTNRLSPRWVNDVSLLGATVLPSVELSHMHARSI
jgi:hypothetical protein